MHRILFSSGISKQIYIYKRIYNRARPHQISPEEINIHKGTMLSSKPHLHQHIHQDTHFNLII
jgi:hypothetical protein